VCVPLTLDDLAEIVKRAAREGRRIRLVGSGFSWSGLSETGDTLVFCERLHGVEIDRERRTAWVECGTTNRQLNAALAGAGLQMPWNVVLENVRVAGVVSVGTHGSGRGTATLGDLVEAFDVIDAAGERRILSEETIGAEGMAAARLGLGLFGVIARVLLRVEPAHRVLLSDRRMPIDAALAALPELVATKDSVELLWFPFTDWAWIHTFERTERAHTPLSHGVVFEAKNFLDMILVVLSGFVAKRIPATLPWMMRRSATALSFGERVVPLTQAVHYRRWLEMQRCSCVEVGFPTDAALRGVPEAFEGARRLVDAWAARGRHPLDLAVNVRFVGPSSALLSAAYGSGICCFIDALCVGRNADWEAFSRELCALWLANAGALPHWGKEFEHLPGIEALARERLGERLTRFREAWRAVRVDPDGMFGNALADRIFLGPRGEATREVA
jgi:FAD/FMN-containing dehydrogenase